MLRAKKTDRHVHINTVAFKIYQHVCKLHFKKNDQEKQHRIISSNEHDCPIKRNVSQESAYIIPTIRLCNVKCKWEIHLKGNDS